jgi:4-hydroxy-2-oxoheptanedioate aldolase
VLKQVLDLGAQTIMVPMIDTAVEAAQVVQACRFPPGGTRGMGGRTTRAGGYGAWPDYPAQANDQIAVILQVESRLALSNLDAIAAIEGVDCVFIGPADLAADMGFRDDIMAPALWDAITRAVQTIRDAGKVAGISGPPQMDAAMIEAGVRFISVGMDSGVMTDAFRDLAGARP